MMFRSAGAAPPMTLLEILWVGPTALILIPVAFGPAAPVPIESSPTQFPAIVLFAELTTMPEPGAESKMMKRIVLPADPTPNVRPSVHVLTEAQLIMMLWVELSPVTALFCTEPPCD